MKKLFLSLLFALLLACPLSAAITATLVTSGTGPSDSTTTATYTTASVTLHANCLEILVLQNSKDAGSSGTPSASSTGATWHAPASQGSINWHTTATPTKRLGLLYTMVTSNQTGAITITFSGSTVQDGAAWILVEFANVDTSGVDGLGAIVQAKANSGGSGAVQVTCTLPSSFGDAVNNVAFGGFSRANTAGIVPGSGFTELADVNYTLPNVSLQAEWRTGEDLTVDATWTGGTDCACDALEIKAAPAGPSAAVLAILDDEE